MKPPILYKFLNWLKENYNILNDSDEADEIHEYYEIHPNEKICQDCELIYENGKYIWRKIKK